jgi:hypothetical protein
MKKLVFFCLLFIFFMATAFAGQSRETLTLAAEGCRSLRIDCGAGDLKVQGDDKLDRIEVHAVLTARGLSESELPEFKKEHVILKLEKAGERAILTARIESSFSLQRLFGGVNAYIDLEVRLPRRLALDVEDGSGDIEIRSMDNGLELEDGSGDVHLEGIGGTVEIDDGSGDLDLAGLKGEVKIDDGSGDIELKGAGGDVSIEDGSGQIEVYDVRGSVEIDDGSGDIIIDGVEQDVTIEEAGSGSVEIRNVKGRVRK